MSRFKPTDLKAAFVPLENLAKDERKLTPLYFAKCLVGLVHGTCGPGKVAILFCEPKTKYWNLWPTVEIHGPGVDATHYRGPHPVICHPHCGPWGKHKAKCHHPKTHGIFAMAAVHMYGGIVEQPLGSSLFRDYGKPGGGDSASQPREFRASCPETHASVCCLTGKEIVMKPTKPRHCRITSAAVEKADGGGDGAYDLHDVKGTPDEIGQAIAESLKETEMMSGRNWFPSEGTDLYLVLKIRFGVAPIEDEEDDDDEDDEVEADDDEGDDADEDDEDDDEEDDADTPVERLSPEVASRMDLDYEPRL